MMASLIILLPLTLVMVTIPSLPMGALMASIIIAFLRKMRYNITDLNGVKNIELQNVIQL
jgi:hypothetical protein